ncbi:MAG TPA: hypothetical protein VJ991_02685 [Balneolales bacterium]|nr:hypothetical protein [Balneolales bacterium]
MKARSLMTIMIALLMCGTVMGQNMPNVKLPKGILSNSQIQNMLSNIDLSGNSDYEIRVPVNITKLNWRVKKVLLICTLINRGSHVIVGVGIDTLDVSTTHKINNKLDIPIFLNKTAVNKGIEPENYVVNIDLINNDGKQINVSTSKNMPYWAKVDQNGKNSFASSGTKGEKYIGVRGNITNN